MILGDMLSELRNNILRDVTSLIAAGSSTGGVTTQLWTDNSLIAYIDQAHFRFARRTLILRDGSTQYITQIPLVAGQTLYTLDPTVLSVLSARYGSDVALLPRASAEQLGEQQPYDNSPLGWNVNRTTQISPSRPKAWTTDESERTLRVFPAPSLNDAAITYTGTIVGNVLTVATTPSAAITVGQTITGAGVLPNTVITFDAQSGLGPTGTGGTGTYFINTPATQTVPYAITTPISLINAGTLFIRVARLPLASLSSYNLFAVPDVPAEYHLDLLEWAAFKALSNHELDSGNTTDDTHLSSADRHKANFELAIKEATQEAKRTMFAQPRWDFRAMPGLSYGR